MLSIYVIGGNIIRLTPRYEECGFPQAEKKGEADDAG